MGEKLNLKYDEDRGTYYEEVDINSCDSCNCGGCKEENEVVLEKVDESSDRSCEHCSLDIDVTKIEPEENSKKKI